MLKKTLCASLFGGLVISTAALAAPHQLTNFVCNMGAVSNGTLVLVSGSSGSATAKSGKLGALVQIPASCTQSNVCKFTYTIGLPSKPTAQNNNADTTLPNWTSVASTGVYYAYDKGTGAGECFLKPLGNLNDSLSINTTMAHTGESVSYWQSQGYTFN